MNNNEPPSSLHHDHHHIVPWWPSSHTVVTYSKHHHHQKHPLLLDDVNVDIDVAHHRPHCRSPSLSWTTVSQSHQYNRKASLWTTILVCLQPLPSWPRCAVKDPSPINTTKPLSRHLLVCIIANSYRRRRPCPLVLCDVAAAGPFPCWTSLSFRDFTCVCQFHFIVFFFFYFLFFNLFFFLILGSNKIKINYKNDQNNQKKKVWVVFLVSLILLFKCSSSCFTIKFSPFFLNGKKINVF